MTKMKSSARTLEQCESNDLVIDKGRKQDGKPQNRRAKGKASILEVVGTAVGGQSKSAINERELRRMANAGLLKMDEDDPKWLNFASKCRELDPDCGLDVSRPREVQHSYCKQWRTMKAPYNVYCFRRHIEEGKCTRAKPAPEPDTKNRTLFNFSDKFNVTPPTPKSQPQLVLMACPGLTAEYDSRIEKYLDSTGASGGGSISINRISQIRFSRPFSTLDPQEAKVVRGLEQTYRTWRNDTTNADHKAVYATGSNPCVGHMEVRIPDADLGIGPCKSCRAIYLSDQFQSSLRKEREKNPANGKYIPKLHYNETQAQIVARHKGLGDLLNEVHP